MPPDVIGGILKPNTMNGIELEIFYHTDETRALGGLDIDYDLSDCEKRKMTFYHINAIGPYIDEKRERKFCSIHTNNSEYISPLSYEEIKARLANFLTTD